MRLENYLQEMKIYNQAWPDFKYLIHLARSTDDRESIMKNGFELGRNDIILRGVYTRPKKWMSTGEFKNSIESKKGLEIMTRPDAKVFDNGCDRPMDALYGYSESPKFRKIYKEFLNKLGFKIDKIDPNKGGRGDPERERYIDDHEARKKFQKMLYDWLQTNGYSLYVNGGEIIIVNPQKAIALDGVKRL